MIVFSLEKFRICMAIIGIFIWFKKRGKTFLRRFILNDILKTRDHLFPFIFLEFPLATMSLAVIFWVIVFINGFQEIAS